MADQVDRSVRSLPLPPAQLLVYRFGRAAEFEGRLVGALQRIKSGGALRILDALFVRSDAKTGELTPSPYAATAPGESSRRCSSSASTPESVAARPRAPSEAIAGRRWARTGGTRVASEFVGATALAQIAGVTRSNCG